LADSNARFARNNGGRRPAHLARLTVVALVVFQATLAPAGPAAGTSVPLSAGDLLMQLPPEADISLAQSASPDPVAPDSDLTYSIEVSNAGPDAAMSVLLTEPIPSGTTFVLWDAKNFGQFVFACEAPGQLGPQEIRCFSGRFPPGVASFTLVVHVDPALEACSVITNTVSVSSPTTDPDPSNNTNTATTQVACP